MQSAALFALLLAACWLVVVAAVCILRPDRARAGLASMGSTWLIQIGEHVLRGLVGAAMIVRAPLAKVPEVFTLTGWFIAGSSLLILCLPKRWHNAYSVWWSERIPLWGYRLLALPTLILAALLAYLTL